jgi:hypothetical protein
MSNLAADGNNSGTIDAADYVVWRNLLAEQPAVFANGVQVVPEPPAIIPLTLALLSCHFSLRRRTFQMEEF